MRTITRNAVVAATVAADLCFVKRLLLAGAAAFAITTVAKADIITVPINDTLIDPSSFHFSNSLNENSPIDPVPITSTTNFFLNDNNNDVIPAPVEVFFAVPIIGGSSTAPTVTSATYSGGPPQPVPGAVVDTGKTLSAGQDLYTVVGCTQCDNSNSFTNYTKAAGLLGLPEPAADGSYEIYSVTIPETAGGWPGYSGKDGVEFFGNFSNGTFLAALAADSQHVYDNAFTEAGEIDGPAVPEPSTWAMIALGFAGLGFAAFRRSRKGDISIVSA